MDFSKELDFTPAIDHTFGLYLVLYPPGTGYSMTHFQPILIGSARNELLSNRMANGQFLKRGKNPENSETCVDLT